MSFLDSIWWNMVGTFLFLAVFVALAWCYMDIRRERKANEEAVQLLLSMGYTEEELGYVDMDDVVEQIASFKRQAAAEGTTNGLFFLQVRYIQ